ncbi:MAG: ribosome maturation factor RimP [Eubacteriales bacterium]|nr:ribosome maturation factor RimP [Eubacteriales bacterium]
MKKQQTEQLIKIAQALADAMGYTLVEAAFEKEHAGVYLRIYLDKAGGISLDDCEKYHMSIMEKVKNFDYDYLEVCSPGIDRPIKTEWDAQRAKGQTVEVKLYKAHNGSKTMHGRFLDLNEAGYHIDIAGEETVIPKADVAMCRMTFTEEELNQLLEKNI